RYEITEGGHSKRRIGDILERAACKIWLTAMKNSRRYMQATRLLRLVQRIFGRKGKDGVRTLSVPGWSDYRELLPVAARSFRERWPDIQAGAVNEEKRNGRAIR